MDKLYILPLLFLYAVITHECGHWLMARWYGQKLSFKFEWGKPITWQMPSIEYWKQRRIALAGFGCELLCSFVSIYTFLACLIHISLYKVYAGDKSELDWL